MHNGMQCDPIQGRGHETLKVGNPSIFKSYLLCHLQLELGERPQLSECKFTETMSYVEM